MATPVGVYTCKLDDKGRLLLPAQLKNKFQPVLAEGFILKQSVYKPALELYPMARWNKLMEKLEELDPFQEDTDVFIRTFVAGHREVEVDKPGRILVTKELQAYAGLGKEVIIASMVGKVEIWDKAKYYEVVNDPNIKFGELAKTVMSKNNNPE